MRHPRRSDPLRIHSREPQRSALQRGSCSDSRGGELLPAQQSESTLRNSQNLRYETGQETPITLVRTIQDVGTDNQGINFDLANLILYGKANPVDAIELLGPYVQGIHAKDGLWPANPRKLGEEVPIGKGKVDFPRIITRLKEIK